MLKQKSPIAWLFNSENLAHFENCPIAVKQSKLFNVDQQMINEIRICSKIGYHHNICTMLGYVSTDNLTCLLLELAQSSLPNALQQMKADLSREVDETDDIIRYLNKIAVQIADGMVGSIRIFNILKI
jgi:hypothetical protein